MEQEYVSTTTHTLVKMLQTVDSLDLFPCEGNMMPFLLLDCHCSRLEFLL